MPAAFANTAGMPAKKAAILPPGSDSHRCGRRYSSFPRQHGLPLQRRTQMQRERSHRLPITIRRFGACPVKVAQPYSESLKTI
jgi:hypothetical protein